MRTENVSTLDKALEAVRDGLTRLEIWRLRHLSTRNLRGETSTSEREIGYLAVCGLAARCETIFRYFKRNRHYKVVLEHVNEEQGREYLKAIKEEDEELLNYVPKFQENDLLGSPITFDYDVGRFSPTTLRYVKVLADLKTIFGDLSGLDVCEIGAGYGGQCKIISDVFNVASYTIIDLKIVLPLIRKYLERVGVRRVMYLTQDQLTEGLDFDLVISNYAFSECVRRVQDHYLKRILSEAQRGYLTCNFVGETDETSPYNKEAIIERLTKTHSVRILSEKPRTGPMNLILVWDDCDTEARK